MSPRPGFVLEVDRSTPATLIWHGEGEPCSSTCHGPVVTPAVRFCVSWPCANGEARSLWNR